MESNGQDRDSSKVSNAYIRNCEFDYLQLQFVTAQRDSLVKSPKSNLKEKLIYASIGAGIMVLIKLIIKV